LKLCLSVKRIKIYEIIIKKNIIKYSFKMSKIIIEEDNIILLNYFVTKKYDINVEKVIYTSH